MDGAKALFWEMEIPSVTKYSKISLGRNSFSKPDFAAAKNNPWLCSCCCE